MITAWYGVAGFMLILYVVLDGRNFGAGMLHWLVARTPAERRQVIAAMVRSGRGTKCGWSVLGARSSPYSPSFWHPRLPVITFAPLSDLVVFDFTGDLAGSGRPHQ